MPSLSLSPPPRTAVWRICDCGWEYPADPSQWPVFLGGVMTCPMCAARLGVR